MNAKLVGSLENLENNLRKQPEIEVLWCSTAGSFHETVEPHSGTLSLDEGH